MPHTNSEASPTAAPRDGHVDLDGERCYRIADLDGMAPFLIALASDSDHWMFLSSTGALTAGRRDPDHALFPYYTDDKVHDGRDLTGGKTIIAVHAEVGGDGARVVWEPLSPRSEGRFAIRRSLAKSVHGNSLHLDEENPDLGLAFGSSWGFSERFGFVRRAWLENRSDRPVAVSVVDGVQNLLPSGVSRRFQLEYSTLADGYKKSELDADTGLGLFMLSSIPTDKAEPSESLRATTVWGTGLPGAGRLLSTVQLDAFRRGTDAPGLAPELDVRGRRGAYLATASFTLAPGERRGWLLVADVDQDVIAVSRLREALRRDPAALAEEVLADVRTGTANLARLVGAADGLQRTGDELDSWRHYSNTLWNVLRGGTADDGYAIRRDDFLAHLETQNRTVAAASADLRAALPARLDRAALIAAVEDCGDPDLARLAREYLPITFGRRHGDPSRPWNSFTIRVKDEHGGPVLDYEGNWRDIFQNWEALSLAYPRLLEGMIFKFLDCSTADGWNPYHVSRRGFDWEVVDPHDEWSFIGYWGDHQVIYLAKLLERLDATDPDALGGLFSRRLFAYANVPYRLHAYDKMLVDPQHTIDFDEALDAEVRARAAKLGNDGKLLQDGQGRTVRANLTEKLLVMVLARLGGYVADAGIWMNTQRPEWNDANNALVGHGVSVVTLAYLRRFLAFLRPWFNQLGRLDRPVGAAGGATEVAAEVATWLDETDRALAAYALIAADGATPTDDDRRGLLDLLGGAFSRYREALYGGGLSGARVQLDTARLGAFCDRALAHIDHALRANRRDDGLYHAYNLMSLGPGEHGGLRLRRLYEMLEGQVAALSSGLVGPVEAVKLLDALRQSALYRQDEDSYLLYPDRRLPRFLEKNRVDEAAATAIPLVRRLLDRGDGRILARDAEGTLHFHSSLRNQALLDAALDGLRGDADGEVPAADRLALRALYERTFDHQSFTGRSGTFYKYEGLGCIYWHMVSKLLLAVHEVRERLDRTPEAQRTDEEQRAAGRLREHYDAIRAGIGVHKSPARFGAVPTDPHSHTPSFAGAQQPGMTGQVKEDLLTRQGELGLSIVCGCLAFRPGLVDASAFLAAPGRLEGFALDGSAVSLELPAGTYGFTTCQVPVVVHRQGPARIEVHATVGSARTVDSLTLDAATSAAILDRTGAVARLDVWLGVG